MLDFPSFLRNKRLIPAGAVICKAVFVLIALLPVFFSARAAASCTPAFPLENNKTLGWLGADAAYSIPLPDGRDVWIFGDTLYGKDRVVQGNDPRMVHNSLGISRCTPQGKWKLTYAIKHDKAGHALSYFSPSDPNHWYWALDGFYARGKLWVTLLCIRHPAKPAPAGFDFETCGSDLAEVSNLDRDPQEWEVDIHSLVADGVGAYPSATAVVYRDYAYIFALYESGSRPLLATRVPLSGLSDPKRHIEYLAEDGQWKPGFNPAQAKRVMERGSTELSIRYDTARKHWKAVMLDPDPFSDKILFRTAPDLAGPWSEGSVIYRIPEMNPKQHQAGVFCYAAKEHPEFETDTDVLLTYVCNTAQIPDLVTNRKIYFPQVVRIPEPAN